MDRSIAIPGEREARCVAWSPDGARIAVGSCDGVLRIWDALAPQAAPLATVDHTGGTDKAVISVVFSDDGSRIASAGFDGQVRIWEPMAGRQLVQLTSAPGPNSTINWLASTPEGFINGSGTWLKAAQWRLAEKPWQGSSLSPAATQPDAIRQAFRGEKLGEPGF